MTETQAFEILGIDGTKSYKQGYNRYRYLAKKHHPDKGGDTEKFQELQSAWERIKGSLPKLPLVVLVEIGHEYLRWIHDGTVHGNWISYSKEGGAYHLIEKGHVKFYRIPEEDKVLQKNVNCELRVVGEQVWRNRYGKKRLWVVPMEVKCQSNPKE